MKIKIYAFPYEESYNHSGMELRDYFAAKAMQSFLTIEPQKWNEMFPDSDSMAINVPKLAYEFADAMMKAREL